MTDKTQIS